MWADLGGDGRASAAPGGSEAPGSCSLSESPRSQPPLAGMEGGWLRELLEVLLMLLKLMVEVVKALDHQHRCQHNHQSSRGRYQDSLKVMRGCHSILLVVAGTDLCLSGQDSSSYSRPPGIPS